MKHRVFKWKCWDCKTDSQYSFVSASEAEDDWLEHVRQAHPNDYPGHSISSMFMEVENVAIRRTSGLGNLSDP